MSRTNKFSLEAALYIVAFFLALALRLVNLGAVPLNESEASLALRAMDISQGKPADFGSQPAYVALTSLTFDLSTDTNFTARLWPALVGASLTLLPLCFRKRLGRLAALILAFGLAIDPGLTAASRQAGGTMLALSFSLFALGLADNGLALWAGIAAGLALLSGPALLPGLIGLAAMGLAARLLPSSASSQADTPGWDRGGLRNFLLSGLVTILLVGTIFFRAPQGVSGWLAGIPAYLSGWTQPPEMPAVRLLVSIPIYQPLAVLFGIWGLFLGWFGRVRNAQALSLWFLVALLLALANPARQMSDLVWASIPLWGLATLTLSSVIWEPESQFAISLSQAALIFFLMALAGLNLAALGEMDPGVPGYATRFALIAGVLALGAVTTSLVGLGWSWLSARQGLVWGLTASFLAVTLSGLWGATQFRLPGRVDLLQPVPSSGDIDLLVKTVVDLSNWSTGEKNAVDLTLAVDSPALHWALRDYANLTILPAPGLLPSGGSPSIVITPSDLVDPGLSASYRGQDFIYRTYPSWTGALPEPAIRWLAFGWASLQGEQVILWARVDLFPGGAAVSSNPSAGSRFPGANLP